MGVGSLCEWQGRGPQEGMCGQPLGDRDSLWPPGFPAQGGTWPQFLLQSDARTHVPGAHVAAPAVTRGRVRTQVGILSPASRGRTSLTVLPLVQEALDTGPTGGREEEGRHGGDRHALAAATHAPTL